MLRWNDTLFQILHFQHVNLLWTMLVFCYLGRDFLFFYIKFPLRTVLWTTGFNLSITKVHRLWGHFNTVLALTFLLKSPFQFVVKFTWVNISILLVSSLFLLNGLFPFPCQFRNSCYDEKRINTESKSSLLSLIHNQSAESADAFSKH